MFVNKPKSFLKSHRSLQTERGFALPTVLVSSVIMLMVLVTAVSFTVAVRTSLEQERYNTLAGMAAASGTAFAQTCLEASGNVVTWSDAKPLKPDTDCNGDPAVPARSAYVIEPVDCNDSSRSHYRTTFIVKRPTTTSGNVPVTVTARGYVELLRKSSCSEAWKVYENSDLVAVGGQNDGTPVGASLDGYWTSAPQGYLLEDGSEVSRTTYADLFSVLGTTFGAGDGSTTFNLPDSRGKIMVAQSTDTEFDSLGETGGEKTHTLSVAEMPSHEHGYTGQTTANGVGQTNVYFKQHDEADRVIAVGGSYNLTNVLYTNNSANGWVDTYSNGSGEAHNNLQPYIVALRVIKY